MKTVRFVNGIEKVIDSVTKTLHKARANSKDKKKKTSREEKGSEYPMWLCVIAAINEPELVREFDRLKGTNLSRCGSSLDSLIDESTGRLEHDFNEFVEFVRDAIYERINVKCERH